MRDRVGVDERGFTLVEVLVSLGLLVIITTGLMSVMATAAAQTLDARRRSIATSLAAAKLEELQGLAWSVRVSGGTAVMEEDEVGDEGVEYVDAEGRVGQRGEYERRWMIRRRGSGASEMRMFEVAVVRLSARPRELAQWRRDAAVVWVFGARVRRARSM